MNSYITDVNNNIIPGKIEQNFGVGPEFGFAEVAIAANLITVTGRTHFVNNAGTINDIAGGVIGDSLVLMRKPGTGSVIIADDAGTTTTNVIVHGGSFTIDSDYDIVRLEHNGTEWVAVGSNFS